MAFGTDFVSDFDALSALLKDADDGKPQLPSAGVTRPSTTPAAIGPKDLLDVTVAAPKGRKDPKEIWQEDELQDDDVLDDDLDDGREVPEYTFLYKQAVDTADTYLGMSGKDPSSTQCEALLVRIALPGVASAAEVDLDVQPNALRLSSAQYKLAIHLPHKVAHETGNAKFDVSKKTLSVSLYIIREDPF